MNFKISYIIFLSIFSPLLGAAEDIKTIENGTKYEGSATYPKIELYPGQLKDFAELTENMRVLEIKRLLNILNLLRNNEIGEAIQILEAELQETVKALKSQKTASKKAKDVLEKVSDYSEQYANTTQKP